MDGAGRGNHVSDHVVLQLITVIAERDAALLEKNTAIAEKMVACAERDAALLERDVALADRDAALRERDAAISTLAKVEKESLSSRGRKRLSSAGGINGSKLLQRVGVAEQCSLAGDFSQPNLVMTFDAESAHGAGDHRAFQRTETQAELQRKQSPGGSAGVLARNKVLRPAMKKTRKPLTPQRRLRGPQVGEEEGKGQIRESQNVSRTNYTTVPVSAPTPIPYCSCTGTNQQCYRWGNGGWQSACCTTLISLYPLPTNPKKRGSRLAGRKMSAGAFEKLLEKLASEGVDISYSVDLKDHWAKHGTNRYVTLR
jgi:hypothetical protein